MFWKQRLKPFLDVETANPKKAILSIFSINIRYLKNKRICNSHGLDFTNPVSHTLFQYPYCEKLPEMMLPRT